MICLMDDLRRGAYTKSAAVEWYMGSVNVDFAPYVHVDQYALQWTKQEIVELSVLSSWKEMVKDQIEERISKLKQNFKQPTGKVLQNADVKACLSDLHNKYVFVPADKAPNNIIIICKRYYIETLIKELGLDNSSTTTGNSTYTPCQMSSEDIVNTHDNS